jgi:hypothetical protein
MKTIIFGALAFFVGCSAGAAAQPAPSLQTEVARFAAVSVSAGQGVRAIISNVIASGKDTDFTPCQLQIRFFGPDGSLIGDPSTVQLRAGESSSIPAAARASGLLRATVSLVGGSETSKFCELRPRVEVFDLQTDTTFLSLAAEPFDGSGRCDLITMPASIAGLADVSNRDGYPPQITSSISGRKVTRKQKKPATLTPTP